MIARITAAAVAFRGLMFACLSFLWNGPPHRRADTAPADDFETNTADAPFRSMPKLGGSERKARFRRKRQGGRWIARREAVRALITSIQGATTLPRAVEDGSREPLTAVVVKFAQLAVIVIKLDHYPHWLLLAVGDRIRSRHRLPETGSRVVMRNTG